MGACQEGTPESAPLNPGKGASEDGDSESNGGDADENGRDADAGPHGNAGGVPVGTDTAPGVDIVVPWSSGDGTFPAGYPVIVGAMYRALAITDVNPYTIPRVAFASAASPYVLNFSLANSYDDFLVHQSFARRSDGRIVYLDLEQYPRVVRVISPRPFSIYEHDQHPDSWWFELETKAASNEIAAGVADLTKCAPSTFLTIPGTDALVFPCGAGDADHLQSDGSEYPVPQGWRLVKIGYGTDLLLRNYGESSSYDDDRIGVATQGGAVVPVDVPLLDSSRWSPNPAGGFWGLGATSGDVPRGSEPGISRLSVAMDGTVVQDGEYPEPPFGPDVSFRPKCMLDISGDAYCFLTPCFGNICPPDANTVARLSFESGSEIIYPNAATCPVINASCYEKTPIGMLANFRILVPH